MAEVALGIAAGILVWWLSIKPSNARRWAADQVLLPEPDITGEHIHIKNIRNFVYRTEDDFTPGYYDKTFNVQQLKRVYLLFTPFDRSRHAAHAFLSFEFADESCVAVSVEIRKKHHEKYSAWKGLLKQYELMYVIADERDVVTLRTHCRQNNVFMYPLRMARSEGQQLFRNVVARAHKLVEKPEFYNTVRNACVTNLAYHINQVIPKRIPFDVRLILSGYADRYFHRLGLLDTHLSFEEARSAFAISDWAKRWQPEEDFSQHLRKIVLRNHISV